MFWIYLPLSIDRSEYTKFSIANELKNGVSSRYLQIEIELSRAYQFVHFIIIAIMICTKTQYEKKNLKIRCSRLVLWDILVWLIVHTKLTKANLIFEILQATYIRSHIDFFYFYNLQTPRPPGPPSLRFAKVGRIFLRIKFLIGYRNFTNGYKINLPLKLRIPLMIKNWGRTPRSRASGVCEWYMIDSYFLNAH